METRQLNLRASASPRWIACPASAKLSAKMPYVESGDAAKIGTAIHSLAETCYTMDTDPMTFVGKEVNGILMTEENCEFALHHLKAIWAIEDELGEGTVSVEQFIPYQETQVCKVGGTTDVIGISKEKRKLIIADLKTGRGYVDQDSDQLKLYAISAMNGMNLFQEISTVELWIIQPHHGEIRKHTMTTQDLVDWEHYILIPAIEQAMNPDCQPTPTESACKYCPAKTICPAQQQIVEVVSNAPPIEQLSEQQISVLLTQFDMVEDYIKAVREHALKRMESGSVIAGWQLTPKRALRSWTKDSEVVPALIGMGLTIDQVVKQELITPAQAEKLLPKDLKAAIEPLTSRISSGLTLARDKGLTQ